MRKLKDHNKVKLTKELNEGEIQMQLFKPPVTCMKTLLLALTKKYDYVS